MNSPLSAAAGETRTSLAIGGCGHANTAWWILYTKHSGQSTVGQGIVLNVFWIRGIRKVQKYKKFSTIQAKLPDEKCSCSWQTCSFLEHPVPYLDGTWPFWSTNISWWLLQQETDVWMEIQIRTYLHHLNCNELCFSLGQWPWLIGECMASGDCGEGRYDFNLNSAPPQQPSWVYVYDTSLLCSDSSS